MRRLIVRGPGLRGPAGADGKDGLPGLYAIPADEAVAAYVEAGDTRAAVETAVADFVQDEGPVKAALADSIGEVVEEEIVGERAVSRRAFRARSALGRAFTVAFLGDSITNQQTYTNVAGADRSGDWGQPLFGSQSWVGQCVLASQGAFEFGGVFATPSYTAQQILDTHVPQVVARAAQVDAAVVLAGTNGQSTLAAQYASLTGIYGALSAAGIRPILCTIPPQGFGAATNVANVLTLNAWIKRYARKNNLPVIDVFAALVNPATGAMQAAYDGGDGIHPYTAAGAAALGRAVAQGIREQLGASTAVDLATTNVGTGLLHTHPLLLNLVSGNIQEDWSNMSALGTSTVTQTDDAGVVGKMMTLTRGDSDINVRGTNTDHVAGRRYQVAFKLKATVPSGGSFAFRLESSSTNIGWPWGWTDVAVNVPLTTVSLEYVLPSGLAVYNLRPRFAVQGAGTQVSIGQFTWRDLTAAGIA